MSKTALTPAHTHDCDECVLVGTIVMSGKAQDIYAHGDEDPTIIIRTGSEGPEYMSFPLRIARQINDLQWGMAVMCYERHLEEKSG